MSDETQLRGINSRLSELTNSVKKLNATHIEFGQLVKKWLETEPAELQEVAVEEMDREPFVVGQIVRVTNIGCSLYKYVGKVVAITPSGVQVKFMLDEEARAYFSATEVEILPQPELHEGDLVRCIDPMSMVYKRIGKVLDPDYGKSTVAVEFGEVGRTAGEIERQHLELVQTRGEAMGEVALEVDDIVEVIEPANMFVGRTGTVIGVRNDGSIRVIFLGQEGYAVFVRDELQKIGEQPYKEN